MQDSSTHPKKKLLSIGLIALVIILVARIFYLQVFETELKDSADNNALRYETRYPPRGLILDRNGKIIVNNQNSYDIMVTPADIKEPFDTAALCGIFGLDTGYVKDMFRYFKLYRRRIGYQSIPFVKQASVKSYSKFIENERHFPGFYGIPRNQRVYLVNAGGNLLGYVTEVDPAFIAAHPEYKPGDYVGKTGIEEVCEKKLRGKKGYRIFLRDAHNVIKSPYKNGDLDSMAIPGENVYSTIDVDLQNYGESLMHNKVGSVVAIEPSTGEILCMISSPGIDASILSEMRYHYQELISDPFKPMFNRAVMSTQPPGSVFKLVNGLIGLQEGVINDAVHYPCTQGYHFGNLTVGCHRHPSPLDFRHAIMMSCNAYFCYAFRAILDNRKYKSIDSSFTKWSEYLLSFGFGKKLGSDFPSEKASNVPTLKTYNKLYGKGRWNSLSCISLSIGQGELGCTPLHLANLAAIMANRGYYYIPHIIRNHDNDSIDNAFKEKHYTMVDSAYFNIAVDGMYMAVNSGFGSGGTASIAHVDSLDICGKTGTAENPHGDTHSVFLCFAPRENPKIAIAVYVENAGFGATWAAPIASLMVEKYLKGDIDRNPARAFTEERMLNSDLRSKVPAYSKLMKQGEQ